MNRSTDAQTASDAQSSSVLNTGVDSRTPIAFLDILETLRCPVDMRPLQWHENEGVLISSDGARRYPVVDGIPCLFAPNEWPEGKSDVTDMVKAFYEETPFPNYDDLDNRESFAVKARRGVFARQLDQQLPRPAVVLEAGCGTGQLSNFLGMGWDRTVRDGNVTYPDVLAEKLSGELGRSVGVMNFGRDGYGVLQMFDLARRKISELKPDIVLIVFITDDLTRDRFWRTSVTIDGRRRMLTTTEPDPTPPLGKSTDTVILEDQASADWCKKQLDHPDPKDSVLTRLEETFRIVKRHSQNKPTPYLLSRSFVFERLAYGDPFAFVYRNLPPATNPRHKLTDFNADPGFAQAVLDIKASGVPVVLLHLAIYEELRDRQYALSTDQLRSLVKSLSRTVEPVYPTLEYSDLDTPDLAKIKHVPNDGAHPSVWGMDFHANAMLRILKANGQLNAVIRKDGNK